MHCGVPVGWPPAPPPAIKHAHGSGVRQQQAAAPPPPPPPPARRTLRPLQSRPTHLIVLLIGRGRRLRQQWAGRDLGSGRATGGPAAASPSQCVSLALLTLAPRRPMCALSRCRVGRAAPALLLKGPELHSRAIRSLGAEMASLIGPMPRPSPLN